MQLLGRRRKEKAAESPSATTKEKQSRQSPEQIADMLVTAICSTFDALQQEQTALLLSLGYSRQNRFDLSVTLAQNLYRSGLDPHCSRTLLHRSMTEGELQAVLYQLVCGDTRERILRQTTTRLLQRPDFRRMAVDYRRHLHKEYDYHDDHDDHGEQRGGGEGEKKRQTEIEEARTALSQVRRTVRSGRRGAVVIRTQRDPRRTLRCDLRPLSQ